MTTETHDLMVSGIRVSVVRKEIKNLHLGVYPPNGRVRVAAPLAVSDAAVRVAVIGKLGWIRRQRAAFDTQERESKREMVSGESHYFLGRRYRLAVVMTHGKSGVVIRNRTLMELRVRPDLTPDQRERVLQRWYRDVLRELATPLLAKWQSAFGVTVDEWGIKKMKTRWGSCNAKARRVWLNLELAKKPPECLEYLIVHELVHLLVRNHDDRFHALMDRHFPSKRLEVGGYPPAAWKPSHHLWDVGASEERQLIETTLRRFKNNRDRTAWVLSAVGACGYAPAKNRRSIDAQHLA